MDVGIVVRKHEMDAITKILETDVVLYQRGRYKFEVQSIPMSGKTVVQNAQVVAFPAMNGITRLYLVGTATRHHVITYFTETSVLKIDARRIVR